jgi:hypothetical protein
LSDVKSAFGLNRGRDPVENLPKTVTASRSCDSMKLAGCSLRISICPVSAGFIGVRSSQEPGNVIN